MKLNNIRDFSTPEGLAQKVYNIEKEKEGVFDVQIISSKETTVNKISMEDNTVVASIPSYLIDYKIDSSRGKNHYLVKSTIVNKQLYVMTAQCKEADFPALETTEKEIIDSFRLLQ